MGQSGTEVGGLVDRADYGAPQVGAAVERANEGPQGQFGTVEPLDNLGEGTHGCRAAGFEDGQEGTFSGDADPGVRVVEGGTGGECRAVVGAHLEGERALPGCRQHLDRVEGLGDHLGATNATRARRESMLPRRSTSSRPRPSARIWA